MNAATIMTNALTIARVIDPEETPSNALMERSRKRLNLMLDMWSIERLNIYVRSENNFTLTIGDGIYTIGEDGTPDIDTVRPVKIEQAYLRDSNGYDYQLDCQMLQVEYNSTPLKSLQVRPVKLFYQPTAPNGTIYFETLPDAADTCYLFSQKPLTKFDDLTTEYNFPDGYEAAITFNIAIALANDNKSDVTPGMVEDAAKTILNIKAINKEITKLACWGVPGVTHNSNRNIMSF